jgi:hypothetical protein
MDASIFFKNGDPSEPRLNAEGSFKNDFKGAFSDEKTLGFVQGEEPKFGLTREELLDSIRSTISGEKSETDTLLKAQAEAQANNKISTGAWIAIGVSVVVVFGGLGYILYKKYK